MREKGLALLAARPGERVLENMDAGVVDPRMAAEAVSVTFLNCLLKGLHRSPRIVTDDQVVMHPGVITAADAEVDRKPLGQLSPAGRLH